MTDALYTISEIEGACAVIASMVRRTTLNIKSDGHYYQIYNSVEDNFFKVNQEYTVFIQYKAGTSEWSLLVRDQLLNDLIEFNYSTMFSISNRIFTERWEGEILLILNRTIEYLKPKIKTSKRKLI